MLIDFVLLNQPLKKQASFSWLFPSCVLASWDTVERKHTDSCLVSDRPNLIMTPAWNVRDSKLQRGLEKKYSEIWKHMSSVAMIYIQYSKKKSNVHLNSGLKTLSDSITLVWNNSVVTYGSIFEWLVCFTVLDDSRYQNLASLIHHLICTTSQFVLSVCPVPLKVS